MRDCELVCDRAVDLDPEERGVIARDFYLEGIRIRAREEGFPPERLGDLYPGSKVEDTEIRLCPQQPRIQTMEIIKLPVLRSTSETNPGDAELDNGHRINLAFHNKHHALRTDRAAVEQVLSSDLHFWMIILSKYQGIIQNSCEIAV